MYYLFKQKELTNVCAIITFFLREKLERKSQIRNNEKRGASRQHEWCSNNNSWMSKRIILFYKYVTLDDVSKRLEEQRCICTELQLTGRMRIATEGLNGSVCGTDEQLSSYRDFMESHGSFGGIQYKYSDAPMDSDPFADDFQIKICSEITSTGKMRNSMPTSLGGQGGIHLKPREFHQIVKQARDDPSIVVIDTRNHYETVVGTFENAIDPKIRNFAQFPGWIDANLDLIRGKKVAMFCTGGIRCEKASAFVNSLNVASEVYQLDGGIHSYLEEFSPDPKGIKTECTLKNRGIDEDKSECLYQGINFQFNRVRSDVLAGQGTSVDGYRQAKCIYCFKHWSHISDKAQCDICKDFVLVCDECMENLKPTVHTHFSNRVPQEPDGKKPVLCYEHQLLSDDWQIHMDRIALRPEMLKIQIETLQALLPHAQHNGRRTRNLTLQLERLEQLFLPLKDSVNCTQKPKSIPFVPAFAW